MKLIKLKISSTVDLTELCQIIIQDPFYLDKPESCNDMTFNSFIIYEYQNSTISFKDEFGYIINDETINYKTAEKDYMAEMLSSQNHDIMKEVLYIAYNLQTGKEYDVITDYLYHSGLISKNGSLSFPLNTPNEITITKDGEGWVTNYSINLDQITIPETTNNNNINTNTNNQNNNTTTDNLAGHVYATPDNNFSISFTEEFGKEFTFIVETFSEALEHYKDNSEELKKINEVGEAVKKELKDNGTFIELYNITVAYNNEEKTEGKFTFRIKYTDEMKKYNTFELINIDDNMKKQDVVKMKLDGDYLVGELPHLSVYALVGKKTSNPGTGITKYTIPGVALLLGTFGVYALYKKKSEI